MTKARLQRVVIGVPDGHEVTIATDHVAVRRPRAIDYRTARPRVDTVLPVGPAGRATGCHLAWPADAQTQSRIADVRLEIAEQPVALPKSGLSVRPIGSQDRTVGG